MTTAPPGMRFLGWVLLHAGPPEILLRGTPENEVRRQQTELGAQVIEAFHFDAPDRRQHAREPVQTWLTDPPQSAIEQRGDANPQPLKGPP